MDFHFRLKRSQMFTECIEMESRTTTPMRSRLVKRVVGEEMELRDLPKGRAISCWWITLPVVYYLAVIAGGVMTCISVGDLIAAFGNNCVFYAKMVLKGLDSLNNTKVLTTDNVIMVEYGEMDTCLFPEYTSVACVMYAGILLVMVLQCGRGGGKSAFRGRGIAESWRIVPVAFVFNLLFLILSSIIFNNVQNGLSTFCDGVTQQDSIRTLGNVSSCADVLTFSFPWDKYNTNLYTQYVIAKTGAWLQLGGSLLALVTIILRCWLPADFVVYRRRKMMITSGIQSPDVDERSDTSSLGAENVVKASVECHNQPVSVEDGRGPNLAHNDTDSVHSSRSESYLVSETERSQSSKFK